MLVKRLKEINSPISGQIQIRSFFGKPRIIIKNMIQSGGMVENIWEKALRNIKYQVSKYQSIENVLILGLGGGSAAQLLNQYFPKAKIIGVEIDPVIIDLGRKHFNLDKINNLKIVNQDAIKYVCDYTLVPNPYSLILVDLYLGEKIPQESETPKFLISLKKILAQDGIIIFNRLYYGKWTKEAEIFVKKLNKFFPNIQLVRAWSNLLVFASK